MTDNSLMASLEACPFCGEPGTIESRPSYSQAANTYSEHRGWCDNCAFGLDWHNYEPDAIDAWNRRAALSTPPIAGQEVRNIAADKVRELRGGVAISDRDFDIADAILALSAPPAVTSQSVGREAGGHCYCWCHPNAGAIGCSPCCDAEDNYLPPSKRDAALAEPASPPASTEQDADQFAREFIDGLRGRVLMSNREMVIKELAAALSPPPVGEQGAVALPDCVTNGDVEAWLFSHPDRDAEMEAGRIALFNFRMGRTASPQSQDEGLRDFPREKIARLCLSAIFGFEYQGESLCDEAERIFSEPNPRAVKAVAVADQIAALLATPATTTEGGRG